MQTLIPFSLTIKDEVTRIQYTAAQTAKITQTTIILTLVRGLLLFSIFLQMSYHNQP